MVWPLNYTTNCNSGLLPLNLKTLWCWDRSSFWFVEVNSPLIAIVYFPHRKNLGIFCFGRFLHRKVRGIEVTLISPPPISRSLTISFSRVPVSFHSSLLPSLPSCFPLCDVTSTFFFKGRWLDIRKYLLPILCYIRWVCSYKNHGFP